MTKLFHRLPHGVADFQYRHNGKLENGKFFDPSYCVYRPGCLEILSMLADAVAFEFEVILGKSAISPPPCSTSLCPATIVPHHLTKL